MSKRKHPKFKKLDLSKPLGMVSIPESKCFGKSTDFKDIICKGCPAGAVCLNQFNKQVVRKAEAKLDKKYGPFADTIDFDRVDKKQVAALKKRGQGLGVIHDYIQAQSRCKDRRTVELWHQNNFVHKYKNPLKIAE